MSTIKIYPITFDYPCKLWSNYQPQMEKLRYQFVDHTLTAPQRDRLASWVRVGSKNNPAGSFGASAELLFQILQTDQIPPYEVAGQADLVWQQEILDTGKHLYYATAILQGIRRSNTHLADKIRESYRGTGAIQDVSLKRARQTSKNYANNMAFTDAFIREFGAYRNRREIWAIATILFPSFAVENEKHPSTYGLEKLDFSEENHHQREELNDNGLTLEQLQDKLAKVFFRRGIIWYYNERIFQHEVIPGIEVEQEIMILPRIPLTIDVISGVEILGKEERKLLLSR